jgi:hypothetical protein
MTNDEKRMTKECVNDESLKLAGAVQRARNANSQVPDFFVSFARDAKNIFVIRASSLFRHSLFVICNFPKHV